MPLLILFVLFITCVALAGDGFSWGDLLTLDFWTPFAVVALAVSEWLAVTDTVKANGILSFLIGQLTKFFKKAADEGA